MIKKYELRQEKKEFLGKTLFRIKALIDGKWFKKGELGGWIEKEKNLSQEDNAWVSGNARVSGDAWVYGKIKLNTILCSRFSFEFDWQIKLWQKKEKEFETELKKNAHKSINHINKIKN